jgi:hypothetical protein
MTMMNRVFVIIFIYLGNTAFGQTQQWSELIVPLPQGWSTNNNNGTIKYSNYNLRPEHPMAITLFPPQAFSGRPDTLFAHVWQELLEKDANLQEVPRWRRFYTEDGTLLQQGGLETGEKENTLYRQLNIYVLDSTYQACLLETDGTKVYRQIQNEWQERLLGVKKVVTRKK